MASADLLTVGGLTTAVRYGLVQATFPALPVRPLTVHRAVLATALFIVVDVATRAGPGGESLLERDACSGRHRS